MLQCKKRIQIHVGKYHGTYTSFECIFREVRSTQAELGHAEREFISYKTSMITDEDPLRGLLFYLDLGFSHTLHVLEERRRGCVHPHLREKGSPVHAGPPIGHAGVSRLTSGRLFSIRCLYNG